MTWGHIHEAAEHYNYFCPDRGKGTANSAGFGLRGGGSCVPVLRAYFRAEAIDSFFANTFSL